MGLDKLDHRGDELDHRGDRLDHRGDKLATAPTSSLAGAARLLDYWVIVYRRTWKGSAITSFVTPLFYVLAMGVLLGGYIADDPDQLEGATSYLAFIAPGLLAASAMNGAVFDSTYNVFFKLKYNRFYDAVLATPLGPIDIALGEIAWALVRGGVYAVAFLAVMGGFGLLLSPWALLALPAALVVAFGFAAVGMAATTYMRSWQDFDLVTLAILPMFLFATTFYPLSVYPRWLQLVVEALPLFHAVELMRGLTTGVVHLGMLGHLCYFLVMIVGGMVVASRRLDILLLK